MEHAQHSSDQSEHGTFPGAKEAIVADLHKALWQDMLQESPHELLRPQREGPNFPAAGIPVAIGDPVAIQLLNASIAERHAKDVGSQILERRHTAAHGLAVNHPILTPNI